MYDPKDYPLPRNQTATLALILRLVAQGGYTWYAVQTAPKDKILIALKKLHEKHRILIDPQARHARREAGLPVAYLVLGPCPMGDTWPMVLLANKRLKGETMYRTEDKAHPLAWLGWSGEKWRPMYLLHRHPDTQRWTWSLTEDRYRQYLEEALLYAKEGDWPKLNALLKRLGKLPSFRGVWEQRGHILRRVQKAWGDKHLRSSKGQWKEPPWRQATEDWPKQPYRVSIQIWDNPPQTVGKCLKDEGNPTNP